MWLSTRLLICWHKFLSHEWSEAFYFACISAKHFKRTVLFYSTCPLYGHVSARITTSYAFFGRGVVGSHPAWPRGCDCGFCDYVLCGCRGPWDAQIRRHCRKSYGISKPIVGVTDQSRLQTTARMFTTLTVFLSPPHSQPPHPFRSPVSGAGHRGPGNGSYSDWPNWTALSSSEKALYGL